MKRHSRVRSPNWRDPESVSFVIFVRYLQRENPESQIIPTLFNEDTSQFSFHEMQEWYGDPETSGGISVTREKGTPSRPPRK